VSHKAFDWSSLRFHTGIFSALQRSRWRPCLLLDSPAYPVNITLLQLVRGRNDEVFEREFRHAFHEASTLSQSSPFLGTKLLTCIRSKEQDLVFFKEKEKTHAPTTARSYDLFCRPRSKVRCLNGATAGARGHAVRSHTMARCASQSQPRPVASRESTRALQEMK
jgi:hypothetical protein